MAIIKDDEKKRVHKKRRKSQVQEKVESWQNSEENFI